MDGGTSLLVHTFGLHRVLRLALLGGALTADEARQTGLVTQVVTDQDLAKATDEMVATLLALPAPAQAATKRLIRQAAEAAPEQALRRELLATVHIAAINEWL